MRTPEEFMARFRGVPAADLWRAINKLTPGINWNRCSKAHIATMWSRAYSSQRLDKVSLNDIARALPIPKATLTAEEREAGCEKFFLNVRPHPLDGWWACHNNWVAGRSRSRVAAIEEAIAACAKNPHWVDIARASEVRSVDE